MPMKRERYPADWEAISLAVRERAGWKCETCGAPNGKYIIRMKRDPFVWKELMPDEAAVWDKVNQLPNFWHKPVRVVLTVHHRGVPYPDGRPGDPHDKMDCRPENLVALCQRCHLREDIALHVANAHRTRRQKKIDAGQAELWESDHARD